MKKVYVFTHGCANRYLDSERMKAFFAKNEYLIIDKPEDADYILVNTCAFKKSEEDISINKIEELKKRMKKDAQIIVGWCLPSINKQRMNTVFDGKSFSPKNMSQIDEIFAHKISINDIEDKNTYKIQPAKTFKELIKTFFIVNKKWFIKKILRYIQAKFFRKWIENFINENFYIRIQNGCLGNCSYCAIKFAIWDLKSKWEENIIKEIRNWLQKWYKRFSLIGDDSWAYGLDINGNFPTLLQDILRIEEIEEINIEEINVCRLVKYHKELLNIFKNKKIKHLLICIQSGSDKILKKMNRESDGGVEKITDIVREFKDTCPNLIIQAQYIVGFPGETMEDLEFTIKNILESKVDEVNLFKFDAKPNTIASKLENMIKQEEIDKRIKIVKEKIKSDKMKIFMNN